MEPLAVVYWQPARGGFSLWWHALLKGLHDPAVQAQATLRGRARNALTKVRTKADVELPGESFHRYETRACRCGSRRPTISRLEGRMEQLDASVKVINARFDLINERFERIDARFDRVEGEIKTIVTTSRPFS